MRFALLGVVILGIAMASPPVAAAGLGPLTLEKAFPNLAFQSGVHITHAGDSTNRLWVVLRSGTIMVFPNSEAVQSASLFLDIRDRVTVGGEEGLLGLAFDPQYSSNGYLYVHYSAVSPRRSVISRFSVSSTDPGQADPAGELVVLEVPQPFSNHNGGTIAFGPDGYLYIGLGDGGSGGDPQGHGQNPATLLGSFLRIDVSSSTSLEPYKIPPDNPFAGLQSGERAEIWAYGMRNPWKFAFDTATGELWAGDVGQNDWEEIDIIERGGNYGWNVMEGAHCYPPSVGTCDETDLQRPVYEYAIPAEGCAIIGGHTYRGSRNPELKGAYIYADYCSRRVWGLRYDGTSVTEQTLLATANGAITGIGTDEANELYFVSFDQNIYRFAASLQPTPVPGAGPWPLLAMAITFVVIAGDRVGKLRERTLRLPVA